MISRRLAILVASAALSISGSAACAEDWDDHPAVQQQRAAQDLYEQKRAEEDARVVEDARARTNNPEQQSFLEKSARRTGVGYSENPEDNADIQRDMQKKWRMVPGPNGYPIVVEDTRGPAPVYQGGFGNPDTLKDPNAATQLKPLTSEMLQLPQQQASGSQMWENMGGNGFFGGVKAPTKPMKIDQSELDLSNPNAGPAWGRDKIQKMHHFVDGQEHHGAEDPHGFF